LVTGRIRRVIQDGAHDGGGGIAAGRQRRERTSGATRRRRIATNFVTLAVTGALGLVLTLLVSIYVRRVLGPTAMGQVSWSLAVIGYLGMIVNPGLTTIGQRELARNCLRGNELLARQPSQGGADREGNLKGR